MTTHKTLAAALIAAQQAFGTITKDNRANTGKYSYTYADLGSVLEAITPGLHANGLVISQCMDLYDSQPCIKTILMHDGSEKELVSYTPIIWADKSDPQKFGGGITYSRRYALMAMLNLNAEDDDGQHARTPAPISREPTPVTLVDRSRQIVQQPETQPERDIQPPPPSQMNGPTRPSTKAQEAEEKAAVLRAIFALAGKLNVDDATLKKGMHERFRPHVPFDQFSRKDLTLDELVTFRESMQKRVDKVKMELSKA